MKKLIYTIICLGLTLNAFAKANVEKFSLENSKIHFYQSGDAMADNSIIIETGKSLIILEALPFFNDMQAINDYTKSLNKEVSTVIANYHNFGMSNYKNIEVLMPKEMIAFTNSDTFAGLTAKFKKIFGEDNLDFSTPENPKAISTSTPLNIDGVELKFFHGATSDFPAYSILIDNDTYYSHFAPAKMHFNTLQIKDKNSIDAILLELNNIKATGAKYILSSHGKLASQDDVDFQIEYLTKLKGFLSKADNSGELGQMLLGAYPNLAGYENVRAISEALLPEELCPTKKDIRNAMNAYFNSVSSGDASIIKEVWADSNASLINGRGHFFSEDGVANFMTKAFAGKNIKLYSSSEDITLLGKDAALVRLYWVFEEVAKDGSLNIGRGRESLVFQLIDNKWQLVHVHYSPLPKQ